MVKCVITARALLGIKLQGLGMLTEARHCDVLMPQPFMEVKTSARTHTHTQESQLWLGLDYHSLCGPPATRGSRRRCEIAVVVADWTKARPPSKNSDRRSRNISLYLPSVAVSDGSQPLPLRGALLVPQCEERDVRRHSGFASSTSTSTTLPSPTSLPPICSVLPTNPAYISTDYRQKAQHFLIRE